MTTAECYKSSSTRPQCSGDGGGGISNVEVGDDGDNTLDSCSWIPRRTSPPSPTTATMTTATTTTTTTTRTTAMVKAPESPSSRPITRSLTPSTTNPHHRPIVMQHSFSFPSSIESSQLIFQKHQLNDSGNVEENADDDEDDDNDSLAFRTRLDIADYPLRHHSSSSSSSSSYTQLLHSVHHRPRPRPCAIIASTDDDESIHTIIANREGGNIDHCPLVVVPSTPTTTRERLNTTDTSATVPSYNTTSMLVLKNNYSHGGTTFHARSHYKEHDAATNNCRELAHANMGTSSPLRYFAQDDVGTHRKTSKIMAKRTLDSDFPDSFTENYVDDKEGMNTTTQTNNATDKIFHTPPPTCRGGGRDRRKGSSFNDNDDLASDVSSLTDALSFQQEDGKQKTSATKIEKEAVVDRRHPFTSRRSRSKSTTAIATIPATGETATSSDASPVRNASPSTTNPVSFMAAALLRKPKVLQRVRSLRMADGAAAASTSAGLHSLEGFDHSLEQQLFVEHIVGREQHDMKLLSQQQQIPSHRSPRPSLVGRGDTIYLSPLGEAIDREKISSSSRRLKSSSSSSQNSRSTSSSTTMSRQRSSLANRSGKSQSSSSRRHHSPLPGNEGRAYASARRHRRINSDGNQVTATRGIDSLWVPTSSPPSLGTRASTTTGIHNLRLTPSSTLPPLLGADVPQRRQWRSNTPTESTRPIARGKTPPRPEEDLIDITYDEPVDPFSGLIGMPPSIIGCGSDDIFGFPTISSSCSSGGEIDNNSSFRSSSSPTPPGGGSFSGMRPPSGKRTPKRIARSFDPLLEGEGCGDEREGMRMVKSSSSSMLSPLRPSAIPPRHYKDDPLLANSRYRQPVLMRSPTSSEHSHHQFRPTLTLRSTSLGSGLNGNPSIGCNTCILGTIAQLEVSTPRGLKESTSAVVRIGSSSSPSLNNDATGHFSCEPGTTSGAANEKSSRTTHTTLPLGKSHDEQDCDYDHEEENGSCRSFNEEYHRREQKHKGVMREVKHVLGLGVVGKMFSRRGSEGAKLKRADGCLT